MNDNEVICIIVFAIVVISGLGWFIHMICDCIKECSENRRKNIKVELEMETAEEKEN